MQCSLTSLFLLKIVVTYELKKYEFTTRTFLRISLKIFISSMKWDNFIYIISASTVTFPLVVRLTWL